MLEQRDRVYIDQKYHPVYQRFKADGMGQMWNLVLLAAAVGFQQGSRKPLSPGAKEILSLSQVSDHEFLMFIRALAIAETKDTKVLLDKGEMLTILEDYANAGMDTVSQHLFRSGDAVKNLIEFALRPPFHLELGFDGNDA